MWVTWQAAHTHTRWTRLARFLLKFWPLFRATFSSASRRTRRQRALTEYSRKKWLPAFRGRKFCIQIRKPKQIYIHALMAQRRRRIYRRTTPAVSLPILAYIFRLAEAKCGGFYFVHFLKRSKWRNFCIRQCPGNRRRMGVPKNTAELAKVHAPHAHTHIYSL